MGRARAEAGDTRFESGAPRSAGPQGLRAGPEPQAQPWERLPFPGPQRGRRPMKGGAGPGVGRWTLSVQGEASRGLRACRGTWSAGSPEPTLRLRVRQADGARGGREVRHAAGPPARGPLPPALGLPSHAPYTWGGSSQAPGEGKSTSVAPSSPQPFLLPLCQVPAPKAPPFLAQFPHAHSPPGTGKG